MEIPRVEPFLEYFEHVRARTARVVELIPPKRLEWSLQADSFTFGDLVRHLVAAERHMFAENALGRPSRYPGHRPVGIVGYDATMRYFERAHAEAMEIFRGLTTDDLQRRCETPGGASIPVWKWLRSMVEHEIHHRGQIYLMLRVIGVSTPPLYGLTSEQVRERSVEARGS